VQQAKLFGLYLNPPPPKAPAIKTPYLTAVKPKPESNKPLAPEPPVSMTPKFRVMAVSIYKGKPEKTMALIGEPGAEPRWIKCGEMVGHLLVEDIQNGQVIWRNGEQTGQVAVLMEPGKKPQEHVTTKRATAEPAIMPDPLVEMEEVKDLPPRSKPTPIKRGLQPRR
jgi:hypothetical protein